jgi:hypothetical protein
MTEHLTPSAIKMLAHGSYSTFSLVHEQQELSGSDCPNLFIITAKGSALSLEKPNKVQN